MKASSASGASVSGAICSCASQRRKSSKVSATSSNSGCCAASSFLAMQGPTNTMPMSCPKLLAQHLAVRQQRREQAGEELRVGGPMLLQVADHGRAGRGIEHPSATLRQGRGRLGGNLLRAQGGLGHAEEAEPLEGADELARGQLGKLADIRGGQRHHDARLLGEELPRLRQIIAHPLGRVRAHLHTVPAQDAQLRHDRGVTALDLDGLDGAVANALVAILAFALFGEDGIQEVHRKFIPRGAGCNGGAGR